MRIQSHAVKRKYDAVKKIYGGVIFSWSLELEEEQEEITLAIPLALALNSKLKI